jgi:putative membrane protein
MGDAPESDPRVYFAAERTLLAWIRTGLALMGFGFVVARFGLFLREINFVRDGAPPQSFRFSVWFGVALLAIGVVVNIAAAWRHVSLVRGLREGNAIVNQPSKSAIAVALILAFVGIAMASYLAFVR